MDILVIISQALLYVCFSVLVGSFILLLVPSKYRPDLKIPKRFLLISAITLPIFAFIPVLDITLFIAPRLGLFESFKIVLTTYTVGTAWNFTLLGSVMLVLLIALARSTEKGIFAFLGAILTFGLMLTVAWSSHAGAIRSNHRNYQSLYSFSSCQYLGWDFTYYWLVFRSIIKIGLNF